MLLLGFHQAIGQLAVLSSVRWYGHVLRSENGHVLRRTLGFEVEGYEKKGRPRRTWKKQIEEGSVKVGLKREDALC